MSSVSKLKVKQQHITFFVRNFCIAIIKFDLQEIFDFKMLSIRNKIILSTFSTTFAFVLVLYCIMRYSMFVSTAIAKDTWRSA